MGKPFHRNIFSLLMCIAVMLFALETSVYAQAQSSDQDDEEVVEERRPTLLERLMFWRTPDDRERVRNPYENFSQFELDDALWRAIHDFNAREMRNLLNEGASPNFRNNQRRTVLIEAARIGFYDGVRVLIEYGASINSSDMYGGTAYLYAYRGGYSDIVLLLQRNGARTVNF